MAGRILAINTGSTSTKIGYYDSGTKVFEENIFHSTEKLSRYNSVMDQGHMRLVTITEFLLSKGIRLVDIDLVMARSGLVTPMETGVYEITEILEDALRACRNGVHACNLAGLLACDIAVLVNDTRKEAGIPDICKAYMADPPMADEMLPEAKIGGIPEFSRRPLCHALNSRAVVRHYALANGRKPGDVTAIVAHMGGGTSVTLHRGGRIIDTNDAHGGDGPLSTERAGTVPAFPLVDMCFSGRYTRDEVKKKLVGNGGAVAYFGTNDFKAIVAKADAGDGYARLFLEGFCLSIAKYIAGLSADVCGKVDVIILTGGIAHNEALMEKISRRVSFIAPVAVYPGGNEMDSLAENGYSVLSGETKVKYYDPEMSENRFLSGSELL